ncbi:ABC transporter permease [Alicyclobacillus kakegawensis]|uniref:ABC transporter permease n=1 Tax=Alicyclobacillus kakegawensis TaxID=392012 RepID=UPI0008334A70|nr:ABC transporter permease [Alicyclobacillus kakegawensis]
MNQRWLKSLYWLLLIPAILFLVLFFLLPLILLVEVSFRKVDRMLDILPSFGLDQYMQIFTSPIYGHMMIDGLRVAALTAVICILLAYPAAYGLVRAPNRLVRTILYIILVSPLLNSVVVRTFAWIVLLSNNGLINQFLHWLGVINHPLSLLWNMKAVIVAYVQVLLPFAVLPISTSLADIHPSLRHVSMSLGAGRLQTFLRITLPLTIPGLISGSMIVFSLAAGSYITPLLIGGSAQPLWSLNIYQQAIQIDDLPLAAAMSLLLLFTVLIIIMALGYVLRRWEKRVYG